MKVLLSILLTVLVLSLSDQQEKDMLATAGGVTASKQELPMAKPESPAPEAVKPAKEATEYEYAIISVKTEGNQKYKAFFTYGNEPRFCKDGDFKYATLVAAINDYSFMYGWEAVSMTEGACLMKRPK